jgi:pheromone a factor receptor
MPVPNLNTWILKQKSPDRTSRDPGQDWLSMDSQEYHRSAQAVAVPLLALLAIILSLPPLAWHGRNRNLPAFCFASWLLICNVFILVNAFIWPDDNLDSWWSGAGLCDVEVKVLVASYLGLPGTLMCIFRNLSQILDTSTTALIPTQTQRRRNLVINIAFCLGLPVLFSIISFVVQRNRYMIFAISGCVSSFDESWASLVLSYMWPLVICLVAAYYCCKIARFPRNIKDGLIMDFSASVNPFIQIQT